MDLTFDLHLNKAQIRKSLIRLIHIMHESADFSSV